MQLFLSLYSVVENENSPENYKTFKISIEPITKYPEMRKFVPDELKAKKICKNPVKKLPFSKIYVPDRYKT